MRTRIGNVYYDTNTSTVIFDIDSNSRLLADDVPRHDDKSPFYWRERLYVKPRGELWLYCEGNEKSEYRQYVTWQEMYKNGYKTYPRMTWDDVRQWLTKRMGALAADRKTEELMATVALETRQSDKRVMCIYIPDELREWVTKEARSRGISASAIAVQALMRYRENVDNEDDLTDLGL